MCILMWLNNVIIIKERVDFYNLFNNRLVERITPVTMNVFPLKVAILELDNITTRHNIIGVSFQNVLMIEYFYIKLPPIPK